MFTDTIGSAGERRFIVQWDRVAHCPVVSRSWDARSKQRSIGPMAHTPKPPTDA